MLKSFAVLRCKNVLEIHKLSTVILTRHISGKVLRTRIDKPEPFPYWDKDYNYFWRCMDYPTWTRFDENTKVIVVDGPIASGKSEIVKKIAEEFEMLSVQQPTTDLYYINHAGYDMRQLDPKLPFSCRSFDEKNFCRNPRDPRVSTFQMLMYRLRFSVYIDCLAHLLHTGQGVVTERSPYTDSAFAYAMMKSGYIPPRVISFYDEVGRYMFPHLLRPHVIVYLDVPVKKVKENIKKRNLPYEVNSPALTDEFLQHMEDHYKNVILKNLSPHCKVLVYDWSEGGDAENIIEDIERITDFDTHWNPRDPMFIDWNLDQWEYDAIRWKLSFNKERTMAGFFCVQRIDVPEVLTSGEDCEVHDNIWFNAPGIKYSRGYDPLTDSKILFKTRDYEGYNNSID